MIDRYEWPTFPFHRNENEHFSAWKIMSWIRFSVAEDTAANNGKMVEKSNGSVTKHTKHVGHHF